MAGGDASPFSKRSGSIRSSSSSRRMQKICFSEVTDVVYLDDEGAEETPPTVFLRRANDLGLIVKEEIQETELPEGHEHAYVNFIEEWNMDKESYQYIRRQQIEDIYNYMLDHFEHVDSKKMNRLLKCRDAFMEYVDIEEVYFRMQKLDLGIMFHQAVVCGDFKTVEFILDVFSTWDLSSSSQKTLPRTQSGRTAGSGRSGRWGNRIGLKLDLDYFQSFVLHDYFKDVLLEGDHIHGKIEDEEVRKVIQYSTFSTLVDSEYGGELEYFSMRWRNFLSFFAAPQKNTEELKKSWIGEFFYLYDTGLARAMLNNSRDRESKKLIAHLLLGYRVPDFLLKHKRVRASLSPVLLADKYVSCRSRCSNQCQKHTGYLLMLMIRLGHHEMVKLCIEHGMSPNLHTNCGQPKSLEWVNKPTFDADSGDKKESLGKISKKNFSSYSIDDEEEDLRVCSYLLARYEPVTPLSRAVESAGNLRSTRIVEYLLKAGANPLKYNDSALRACAPALAFLSKKKKKRGTKEGTEVKCLSLIWQHIRDAYTTLEDNHCTRALLYQAAVDSNHEGIRYLTQRIDSKPSKKSQSNLVLTSYYNFDVEVLSLLVGVIDSLLSEGRNRRQHRYTPVLVGILNLVEMHEVYLDPKRFEAFFNLVLHALKDDIPGDRKTLVRIMRNKQFRNYLAIESDKYWTKRQLDQFNLTRRQRLDMALPVRGKKGKQSPNKLRSIRRVQKEKLCSMAAKAGNVALLAEFVSSGYTPSRGTVRNMAEHALENLDKRLIQQLLEFKYGGNLKEDMLELSMANDNHDAVVVMLEFFDATSLTARVVESLENKIEKILFNHVLKLGRNDDENILAETKFYNEDRLFRVASQYLFTNAPHQELEAYMHRLINHARRKLNDAWFVGFHNLLLIFAEHRFLYLITNSFVLLYFDTFVKWIESDDKTEDDMEPLVNETLQRVFTILSDCEEIQLLQKRYTDYETKLKEDFKKMEEIRRASTMSYMEQIQHSIEEAAAGTSEML
eukprot:CAMPEP_0184026638 /NCGR_PEP_ID=MMETSP0954-20121128/13650_1 /TAXON_ID=627963 /ORGANISM="Aplanochytrium sp, Strain PBS07" /LENGTH=1006 /DNA_ID=CAMNT_0026310901 /DNA_START=89 /DNA_END=3109 /DNA_ORIENTATION=+